MTEMMTTPKERSEFRAWLADYPQPHKLAGFAEEWVPIMLDQIDALEETIAGLSARAYLAQSDEMSQIRSIIEHRHSLHGGMSVSPGCDCADDIADILAAQEGESE